MKSPSWKSLLGGSGALFVVIGAFLAGRVHAGADPALQKQTQKQKQTQTAQPQVQQQSSDQGFDDGAGSSSSTPDTNPPTTQAS
jgi:hypothetical protein